MQNAVQNQDLVLNIRQVCKVVVVMKRMIKMTAAAIDGM